MLETWYGRTAIILLCLSFVGSISVIGCSRRASTTIAKTIPVAVLGDRTRLAFVDTVSQTMGTIARSVDGLRTTTFEINGAKIILSAAEDDAIEHHAALAYGASIVLIATNATVGPLPVHREHVLLARQMETPETGILLTNSAAVLDPELLELEELEMRELLNLYESEGDTAMCACDSPDARAAEGKNNCRGPKQLVNWLSLLQPNSPQVSSPSVQSLDLFVYALTREEAFASGVCEGLRSGQSTIIVRGVVFSGELICPRQLAPGENGETQFRLVSMASIPPAARLVVLRKGHIAAAGVVTASHLATESEGR